IFLRQMLAAARKTNLGGEDNIFSSQGMDTFRQMQDDRFADIASETGAFGLGKMIQTHLAKFAKAAGAAADTSAAATQGVTSNGI
ncbi:MAG TPA: rod-binding protein, partial [Novosphingobium sp.]